MFATVKKGFATEAFSFQETSGRTTVGQVFQPAILGADEAAGWKARPT
jgi:hypothetical protein